MDAICNECRRWCCMMLFGVFLCLLISGANSSAQTLPEDAPIIISYSDSTRALTNLEASVKVPVFKPGGRTKVTLYVTNLDLLKNEGANAFRADIEDINHYRYPLTIISLDQLSDRPWVYALTVQLHGGIGDVGDTLIRVTWRGMSSNRVRLAIGHAGGKMSDDDGAVPTPMPDKPIARNQQSEATGLPYTGDRVRFMEQTTFGPTAELEMRLRRIPYSTWLTEQMEQKYDSVGVKRYSVFPYPNLPLQPTNIPTTCTGVCVRDNYTMYPLQNWFYRETLYGEDQQLRRRVAWALSQIFVVSGNETVQPSRMLPYLQTLDKHAFGNFRDLLGELTLNPAMGNYLDMAISTKQNPNENYAREILQLFSVGVDMLNQDGTPVLTQQGNKIPTYDQAVVNGFTKVFTGWSFCNVGCTNSQAGIVNFRDAMISTEANHDMTSKQLLSYEPGGTTTIPGGLSPEHDLELALNNIFNHPNVGPFIGKLLIQQLVTSNPTPAYVARVAAAFNNNGVGGRGDMRAVIRAILLDPEARGNIKTDPDYGHLREPVLYVTNVLRPFSPSANNNITPPTSCNGQSDGVINGITLTLDQDVYNPPSVFNYYQMDYSIPNTNLSGPEFGIFSTGTALKRPNFVNQMVFPAANARTGIQINTAQNIPCGTMITLTRLQTIAAADLTGGLLVDTLNKEIMHGSINGLVRNEIMTAIQAVSPADTLKRARTALYLVATSSQFQVQR